jgi:hypothetical protein
VPVSDSASWAGSVAWLLGVGLASFLVTWLLTDRLRVPRTPYVGALALLTAGLTAGYLQWLGVDATDWALHQWPWGLLAAGVTAAPGVRLFLKMPGGSPLPTGLLVVALLWEGLVYGVAEGLLLSVLPAYATWQACVSADLPAVLRWTLPLVSSTAVIVVHHLGYWEYRNSLLRPVTRTCLPLTAGYLLSGSPLAASVGHVLAHAAAVVHRFELPPHPHPAAVVAQVTTASR